MIDFRYFSTSKIIAFHGTLVIFEVFAVSTYDATFIIFFWPLGASWGPLGPLLGGFWRPFGVSWEVWGRPWDFLKASWGPWRPRCPQGPRNRLPEASKTPPETSRRHPRGVQEAFQRPKTALLRAMLPPGPGGMREAIKSAALGGRALDFTGG